MKKKRSWVSLVKKLFVSEPRSKAEKKSKRWRWVLKVLKTKQGPALAAPGRVLSEAREQQRKHAMVVAVAAAAAAEAAVAAAQAAAEVVRLSVGPQSCHEHEWKTQNLAALKIQSAYRAHLARKALKALKGLVRLQAMVRGQLVRRQTITKLRCLEHISKTLPQFHKQTPPTLDEIYGDGGKEQLLFLEQCLQEKKVNSQPGCKNSQKNWDYSLFSKEEMEAVWTRKQEAALKRERMNTYSSSQGERTNDGNLETVETKNENRRWINQLDKREQSEALKSRERVSCKSISCSNLPTGNMDRPTRVRPRSPKQVPGVELKPVFMIPRRSFSQEKNRSFSHGSSLPNSPKFPTYMATTESAKAKARSMSTPKQRLGLVTCSEYGSLHKHKLSSWSSFNGQVTSSNGRRDVSADI